MPCDSIRVAVVSTIVSVAPSPSIAIPIAVVIAISVAPVLLLVRFIADDVAKPRPDGGSEDRSAGVVADG